MAGNSAVAFIGRLLFSFLYLSSGAQKLQSFNAKTGGPVMDLMGPKMDTFLAHLKELSRVDLPLEKEHYVILLGGAIFLELAGGTLFLLNYDLGAYLLMLFTATASVVIHNFWDIEDQTAQLLEMIMFFKNVALIGALLFYLGGKPR